MPQPKGTFAPQPLKTFSNCDINVWAVYTTVTGYFQKIHQKNDQKLLVIKYLDYFYNQKQLLLKNEKYNFWLAKIVYCSLSAQNKKTNISWEKTAFQFSIYKCIIIYLRLLMDSHTTLTTKICFLSNFAINNVKVVFIT